MTAYSPLRIDSSEFGNSVEMLELKSETLPIELVLGIPIYKYIGIYCVNLKCDKTIRKTSRSPIQ